MNKKIAAFVMKLPGWLSNVEAEFLEKSVLQTQKLKGEIVEIGSFCGKSTICLAQSRGTVFAIDPHKGNVDEEMKYASTYKQFIQNIKTANVFYKVKPIVKTSRLASKKWNKKIRTLFIDGLHDEKNAERDFQLWSKHLVEGGIIAFHDSFCHWCGSEKIAIKKVVLSKEYHTIGVIGSITYGIKGKGTKIQRIQKLFWQIFIISVVNLNHLKIILFNFPAVFQKSFFKLIQSVQAPVKL